MMLIESNISQNTWQWFKSEEKEALCKRTLLGAQFAFFSVRLRRGCVCGALLSCRPGISLQLLLWCIVCISTWNTCARTAPPPRSTFANSTLPGDDRRALGSDNGTFLTHLKWRKSPRMETRSGRWLFAIFLEWIWLFSATSILAGTKAEVRCSPSCQLTLISAFPWEVSELDLTDSGEASFEDLDGFVGDSPQEKLRVDEKHRAVKSSSMQSGFGADGPRSLQEDALNDKEKLSMSTASPGNVLRAADSTLRDSDLNEISKDDGQNRSLEMEQLPDIMTEDADESRRSWARNARSAETWSGFRAEGVEEASLSDLDEFQLSSSTFALSEDTAHNQAMVHWSGQNSSVSGFVGRQIYARLPLTHCGQHSLTRLAWCVSSECENAWAGGRWRVWLRTALVAGCGAITLHHTKSPTCIIVAHELTR